MHEKTQDAMTYVGNFGRPDLFITFTCNPEWPEIKAGLFPGQRSYDRHDIIARVFNLKVKSLMKLGDTKAFVFSVERKNPVTSCTYSAVVTNKNTA